MVHRREVVCCLSWGQASWHCLSCHMVLVAAAWLSPQCFHPVVSGALSAHRAVDPSFVANLHRTQEEVCSPLKFNRGHLETIPFLKPCPVWQCKPKQVITMILFKCFYSFHSHCFFNKCIGQTDGRTQDQHTTVLVNSEILAKISFLKNHVNWFIVPGCVKLNGMLSCQEADNHSSEKPRSCFHIGPAFSLGKKKITSWIWS